MKNLNRSTALILALVLLIWGWMVKTHQADTGQYVIALGAIAMAFTHPVWKKSTKIDIPVTVEKVSSNDEKPS
jgi:hypothetical protein